MLRPSWFRPPAREPSVALVVALWLVFPALLSGQGAARDALSTFPADTHQILYSNLAQLRALPDYGRIRLWIVTPPLDNFERILNTFRTDVEKDMDEVTLGWRGDAPNSAFFGLAEGRFQPDLTRDYFAKRETPCEQYAGYDLYGFGSSTDRDALFFAFFDSSTVAFGHLNELKAMLDVRAGGRPALQSNSDFLNAEGELEGSALQWGIARGALAAKEAAPWLTGGVKLPADPKALLAPIQLVLYRFDWGSQLYMRMSLLCRDAGSATKLTQVLALLHSAPASPTTGSTSAAATAVAALFQGMDVQTNGARIEMSGSVPIAITDQVLRNGGTLTAP